MIQSPSKFCRGSVETWDAFCASARIVESKVDDPDDLLVETITVPARLPELIAASLTDSGQNYPFSPLISQAELQSFSRNEAFIRLVPDDPMRFSTHMRILCRQYNQFRSALQRGNSEAAIRHAIDDLFSLVFETDDTIAGGSYRMQTDVHVVKYDQRQLSRGPTSIATADGAVVTPLPQALLRYNTVCASPNLHEEYIQSFIEFKGGLHNGRQAVLDSAAMQAVNRSLGLADVKNYAFSVDRHHVDTITSWWEKIGSERYQYCYMQRNNKFVLDTPIGWFRFYSFLCRLRTYHHVVREALRTATPSLLTARELFCEKLTHGNEGYVFPDDRGQGHQSGMQWQDADGDIQLGDEAATYTQISVEDFCRGESDEEDDNDDFDDEDVAPKDVGAKVQLWQKDVVPCFGIDSTIGFDQGGGVEKKVIHKSQ